MKHIILILITLFVSSSAFAYQYWVCLDKDLKWESNNVHVRAGAISFSDTSWRNALSTSIARWNQNPSKFRYSLTFDEPGVKRGNGENEIWFSNDPDALQGAPAIAWTWYECIDYWIFGKTVKMTEVDVIFDVNEAYTPFVSNKNSLWEYGGGFRPFITTAIHELGHGLGLAHVNYTYNVMGQDWTHIHVNGSAARPYVGEDTSKGARHLYGNATPLIQDLAVTHWKYGSASGEYSSHVKTRVYNSAGGNLATETIGGEKFYKVNPGQVVQVEYSYENSGASTQSGVPVGFYISTNDLITTLDTKLKSISLNLAPDFVYTRKDTVTIPAGLASGSLRWLGVIVDDSNSLVEVTETNNATYLPIKVN